MVCAILDNHKTATRKVIKPQPPEDTMIYCKVGEFYWSDWKRRVAIKPLYLPGDILYVQETWQYNGYYDMYPWETEKYIYKADTDFTLGLYPEWFYGWCPSTQMPKEAARIFLRVTRVRVERLQDITLTDAIAEGIPEGFMPVFNGCVAMYPSQHLDEFWGPEQQVQARIQVKNTFRLYGTGILSPKTALCTAGMLIRGVGSSSSRKSAGRKS